MYSFVPSWVFEHNLRRVQSQVSAVKLRLGAVPQVADDRMAQIAELKTYLMRPPRMQVDRND